jgi:hypothetical protein
MSLATSTVSTSLEAIRRELSGAKLSASTMNFVVWIDDPARRDWIRERAAMISAKYPSFTLVLDHSGTRHGDASVTTTGDDRATYTVQGECVEIDVSNADAATVLEYVNTLSREALPTVLWWSGMREDSRPVFEGLLPLVSTIVFDSSGGSADDTAIRRVAEFHAAHPEKLLRDLAWLRLRPWQDMIANFFDDPNLLGELYSIRRLHIRSGSDAEAFYLAGWLSSRLGWSASERGAFTDGAGNIIRFERVREGEMRRVRSICLDSLTSWYHGELTDDPHVVSVWVEGEHAREPRLFTLQAIDNASLLERAILEPGDDDVFETALNSAATLLG